MSDRPRIVLLALVAFVVASGASCHSLFYDREPLFCCLTEERCVAFGAPPGRTFPCTRPGDVCDVEDNACVPDPTIVRCDTPADCAAADPMRPACVEGRCVACGDDVSFCPASDPVCSPSYVCEPCVDESSCSRFADRPFCSAASGACAACRPGSASDCTGATAPICDQTSESCRACRAGECASGLCNTSTGACVGEADTLFVAMNGSDAGMCTRAAPCRSIQRGIDVAGGRQLMTVGAGSYEAFTINGATLTILAEPGASVTRGTVGPVVEISGAAMVTIEGLRIHDGPGNAGDGVRCSESGAGNPRLTLSRATVENNGGVGIKATGCALTVEETKVNANTGIGIAVSGGSATIERSTISGNTAGGISITGSGATFDITNNFVFRNGNNTAGSFGGVSINPASSMASRLEFNTIVDNQAASGSLNAGGVVCAAPVFAAPSNIIARNLIGASTTAPNAQTLGDCTYPTSSIASDVTALRFASPDSAPYDYHVTAGSSAIGQATTSTMVAVDFDGDPRPLGNGRDIGADEVAQ